MGAFTGENFNDGELQRFIFFEMIENIAGKGENAVASIFSFSCYVF